MWFTPDFPKRWRKSCQSAKAAATSGNLVKMRDAHAVFRVGLSMRVDGDDAQYQLTLRVHGMDSAATIERLEGASSASMDVALPFDPVAVKMSVFFDSVRMNTIPGDYVTTTVFLKRSQDGTILSRVLVRWFLSATSGVEAELVTATQSTVDPFAAAVEDAIDSPVSWEASVECARLMKRPLCGVVMYEGYVKGDQNVQDYRWWAPVRIDVELLSNGTLHGNCIGESFRSSVTGSWSRDDFDMSMDFRRSTTQPITQIRLEGMRVSNQRFMENVQAIGDVTQPRNHFMLEITTCGQGPSPTSHSIPPFDFYQEARLAVLSSFKGRGRAPHLLPNALWRHIFVFYGSPWFVEAEKQRCGRPATTVVEITTPIEVGEAVSEEVDDVASCASIPVEPTDAPSVKHQEFPRRTKDTIVDFVRHDWPTILYVGIAVGVFVSLIHTPAFASNGVYDGANSTLFGPDSSVPIASDPGHVSAPNGSAAHCNVVTVHGIYQDRFYYGGVQSTGSSKTTTAIAHQRPPWLLLLFVTVVNAGFVLIPRANAGMLFCFLVGTGFLFARLLIQQPSGFVAASIVDLGCEVTILLATLGWLYKPAFARTFATWERLSMSSRLVLWGGYYVLPFFAAVNVPTTLSGIQSKLIQPVEWPKISISGRTGVLAVAITSAVVAELIKPMVAVLRRQPYLLRYLVRACLLVAVIFSMSVIFTVSHRHHAMLGVVFVPLTYQPSKVAATTQALLLGAFVQGFASYHDQLQHRQP